MSAMFWAHGFGVEFERDLLVQGEGTDGRFVEGAACSPALPMAVAAQYPRVAEGGGGEDCGDDKVLGFVLGFAEPSMVSTAGSVCAGEGESLVGFACCGEAVQLDPVGFAEERQPFTRGPESVTPETSMIFVASATTLGVAVRPWK